MATDKGKSVGAFSIDDVSAGCNYSDDISAVTKSQSPDSLNVEFFNGKVRKRKGYSAITTTPSGIGGIDSYTKLMLHCDGTNASTTFTDSEITPKTVTANGSAKISTAQSKFGGASGDLTSEGIDSNTVLMLHFDGADASTTFTDSELTPKTVTANGGVSIRTAQSKFGGASGYFSGSGFDSYAKVGLHFDNNLTDSTSAPHTFSNAGGVTFSSSIYKFGGYSALLTAGSATSSLTTPDSADFTLGASAWTIDFWVYYNSTTATGAFAGQATDASNYHWWGWNNTNFLFFQAVAGGAVVGQFKANFTPTVGQWYHIQFSTNGSNTNYIFINGVSQTVTTTNALGTISDKTGSWTIGYNFNYSFAIDAYMDEMRFSLGVVRNTVDFTTATVSYGTSDYLTLADSSDWAFGSGDFTIDAWIRPILDGTNAPYQQICGQLSGNTYWYLRLNVNEDTIGFQSFDTGTPTGNYSCSLSGSGITSNAWAHIAAVRNGSNFYIFVNGVIQSLTVGTAIGTLADVASTLNIGVYTDPYYFLGYIDELRISKGIARWTTNFIPKTVAYDVLGYLSIPDSADFNFGSGDFTVDFWVNYRSTPVSGSQYTFYSQETDANNQIGFFLENVGGTLKYRFYVYASSSYSIHIEVPVVTLAINTWYHMALVRNGSNWFIFQDGVQIGSTTVSSVSYLDSTGSFLIGARGFSTLADYFNGYIDEFRVSKGIARWTSDFSVNNVAYDTFNASIPLVGFSVSDFPNTLGYHQQIAHFGTTTYAYDRISNTKVTLRNGTPFTRSFNTKASSFFIQTYNDYSAPYYWDGVASSMALLSASAPNFKRCIEFQGYLIGMNISSAKTRCYYQLIGNIIGATYSDYFTLTPAPNDDEISDPFILNGRLYVGTKYSIFRVSFVGGVTVFEFKPVVSDTGVVPGTAQTVITKEYGQVTIFLGTDKRVYMFDGSNVRAISDLFYYRNATTPIALDYIDDNYKENSFAVYDSRYKIYRLFITKQASSKNYYCMNIDVDTFAYYPFDNMQMAAGCMSYDRLLRPYLVCADYTGILHNMFIDTSTDNGVGINEYYISPMVSLNNRAVTKGKNVNFEIVPSSNANLDVYDKVDHARAWSFKEKIPLCSSRDKVLGTSFVLNSSKLGSDKSVLTPNMSINATFNTYQFKLVCDRNTAAAWEIYNISVDQELLKMGLAEAQR